MAGDSVAMLTTYLVESFREDVIGDTPIADVSARTDGVIELTVEGDEPGVEHVLELRITQTATTRRSIDDDE